MTTCPTASQVGRDATLWAPRHLPQNRDVFMVTGGDGSLLLHRYRYPDQRCVGLRLCCNGQARGIDTPTSGGWACCLCNWAGESCCTATATPTSGERGAAAFRMCRHCGCVVIRQTGGCCTATATPTSGELAAAVIIDE